MAAIYLLETAYEALFNTTVDANSYPTTTNYETIENLFANWLNGKLGIDTAIATDPGLSMCKLWVGYAIYEFSQYNKGGENYVSPQTFVELPVFLSRMEQYNMLINDIENSLSSEKPPAYVYEDAYYGGGARL